MSNVVQSLPDVIMAIGGLGTAAFGLVDSTKVFWGGANRIGFGKIRAAITALTPAAAANGLTRVKIVDTLRANWFNGKDLESQKAIAKSLIKLGLNESTAPGLADATGVDADTLKAVGAKIARGEALSAAETDTYSRFDFILTAILDEVYQDSDQAYTNGTRTLAAFFAVALGFFGGWVLNGGTLAGYWWTKEMGEGIFAGLLATPLAPVAKDIANALSTAVNTMQKLKGK
ncbi:MAG TPA: hypothetical protein VN579_08765 [Bryobacteraceae bacterium]|nr:hypothetical protein [Bryobacteraceae bacterium]